MITNLQKYKEDLEKMISTGQDLHTAMQYESYPEEFEKQLKPRLKEKYADFVKKIPTFRNSYQSWYSEALILLKQLLPDRIPDFVKLYEKPKSRKSIEYGNYVIEDYLQNLVVTNGYGDRKVGPEAATAQFEQQLNIIKSIEKRFESSLFDIQQLVQADIFDSELEAAKELNKKGFSRGAGAVAGVVLEKHLSQVCDNHAVKVAKKNPSISDYNDKLKDAGVFETPTWRKIQHLGDLRNLCDHKKKKEPTKDDVEELVEGVEKIVKTIF
ncbi:hypothetical protein COU74_00845 [Candidatus Peregrinibacteria bacterium CG10_big_fil_rev_8_21_14_0_10_36_19]|nr:MAG: hypothetical protein COU74_00845 [Candidatus Peregrinibacteria bacterium CG10_big_fil_rev_8_21_14_0_10_36_19]